MTSSTINPHASDNRGTLRAPAQLLGWRESLARWIMAARVGCLSESVMHHFRFEV
jgi:hypothetical protein